MKIEVLTFSDFIALEDLWDQLVLKSCNDFFSTWTWLSTWWKHFGNNRELLILVAKEADSIMGLAPLMRTTESTLGLNRSKIEFIGTPDSDYNNFVTPDSSSSGQVISEFLDYLNKHQENWTLASLTDLPQNAPCLSALEKMVRVQQATKCSYLKLPESYDAFLKSLSYKQRGSVNNTLNKIRKSFKAELVDYSSPNSCLKGMRFLIDLHQKRWLNAGFPGAFFDKRIENFHLDLAELLSKKQMLGLYLLEFDGRPVSGSYGFKYKSKYYAYLPGFDPEYSKFGVGSILVPFLVKQFIEEGLVEFDFMRGDEGYKDRWNATPTWNYQAIMHKSGRFGPYSHRMYDSIWCKVYNARGLITKKWLRSQPPG